ncbi:hypothetical protein [Rhizobium sp. LCM 4573]|uniref:hypothetical protein n=1 Tax=Rhizobium sp. LCM 4573 TaxID=1848291 RepID=UPI0008DA0CD4|nr:hypothetical protein [Rhizobium sp. LCM 4573]OHV84481.1 hypothetical protein LCM4573_02065 [Rhizobium sp. LCM 4573]
MTRITSALAAAFIASVSFATAALAEGDYYEGVSNAPAASVSIDRMSTAGIVHEADASKTQVTIDRGDFFDGANRPN